MPDYSHTLEVDAAPERVFAVLDDVTRTPEWLDRCTGIEVLTPGPPAVGTKLRYHYRDGRQTGAMDGVITAYERDRRIAMLYTDKIMDVMVDFVAEPVGTDRSTLKHSINIRTKGLGKVFGPLIARQLPGQTIGAVTKLKRLVESG
jgi:uncharacterized protein YndB with AHSA1/START domain